MVADVTGRVSVRRRCGARYRGCVAARLWRPPGAAACAIALAFTAGGCSFSYQLDNLFGKKDDGGIVYSGPARELAADDTRVRALAGASAEKWERG